MFQANDQVKFQTYIEKITDKRDAVGTAVEVMKAGLIEKGECRHVLFD